MGMEAQNSSRSIHSRLGPNPNISLSGAIFMCNRRTKKECLDLLLFGLPVRNMELVKQIVPGMKLFLFEFEKRELWGVFEATSYGAMNIVPDAYSGRSFPCQVRVKPIGEYFSLKEDEFGKAIRDNYYEKNKFHIHLSQDQVSHLCRLFLIKYTTEIYPEVHNIPEDELCIPNRYSLGLDERLLDTQLSHTNYQALPGCLSPLQSGDLDYQHINGHQYLGTHSNKTCHISNGSDFGTYSHHTGDTGLNKRLMEQKYDGLNLVLGNESMGSNDRSVWSRISACPKSLMGTYYGEEKENILLNSVSEGYSTLAISPSPVRTPKDPFKGKSDITNGGGDHCRPDFLVENHSTEEFAIRFKRRRLNNNHGQESNDQPPTKLRRKLSRPSFDVSKVPVDVMKSETENSLKNSLVTDANSKTREAETLDINLPSQCKDSDCTQPLTMEDQSLKTSFAQDREGSQVQIIAAPSIQESKESIGSGALAMEPSLGDNVAQDDRTAVNHAFSERELLADEVLISKALQGTFCNDRVNIKGSEFYQEMMESKTFTSISEHASDSVNHSSNIPRDLMVENLSMSSKMQSTIETLPEEHIVGEESVCTRLALGLPIHNATNHGKIETKRQSQSYRHFYIGGDLLSLGQPVDASSEVPRQHVRLEMTSGKASQIMKNSSIECSVLMDRPNAGIGDTLSETSVAPETHQTELVSTSSLNFSDFPSDGNSGSGSDSVSGNASFVGLRK